MVAIAAKASAFWLQGNQFDPWVCRDLNIYSVTFFSA